jgi:hypothetical protein
LIETKLAYKNLYSSVNIDNKKDHEIRETNNENNDIIQNHTKNNIIKINLDSLEFE